MKTDTHTLQQNRKPPWLKRKIPSGENYRTVRHLLSKNHLRTICDTANCPNQGECYGDKTATFLIMGDQCTRNCRFCAVDHGNPKPPDPHEPERIAHTAKEMGLTYVVVTSVTRDDLDDGGAWYFARTIKEIRRYLPNTRVEVLVPDFKQKSGALQTVIAVRPDVLNHNLETVPRLYPVVRSKADYIHSLNLIRRTSQSDFKITTKSGLMLGLGEGKDEIRETLEDLIEAGCKLLTLGQYLQPSRAHLPVKRFVPPEEFDDWREVGLKMGFTEVASGPLVRSSYHAKHLYQKVMHNGQSFKYCH